MSLDFPAFALSPEHDALRESVRALAEEKIAPHAAKVDQAAEFPQEAHDALVKAGMQAVHIPEGYGGAGADAIATAIVIEEVARACASSSLIPAVNKLGTVPLLLSGSEELKQRYLPPVASGEAMFSYALSEPEAGSDAAAMSTRAVRDGDSFVLNGVKRWITNAGVSRFYTVMAVTDPSAGVAGISAFVVEDGDAGFSFGAPGAQAGDQGVADPGAVLRQLRDPGRPAHRRGGQRVPHRAGTLDHTRITIAAQALGIAQGALDYATGYVKERRQFGQPVAEFQGVQFMLADMAMKVAAARQLTYAAAGRSERAMERRAGAGPDVHVLGLQVLRLRRGHGRDDRRGAAAGRLRVRQRLPGRADDAGCQDHPDLRGHQPDPACRHGPPASWAILKTRHFGGLTRRTEPAAREVTARAA